MIISHKHKFIFLRTVKTAGTSIAIYLAQFCGENDIITPFDPSDSEEAKMREFWGVIPKNYGGTLETNYEPSQWNKKVSSIIKEGESLEKYQAFHHHSTAREVKAILGDKIWNEYFKFCFVRNPWDLAVSVYFFQKYKNLHPEIDWIYVEKLPLNSEAYNPDEFAEFLLKERYFKSLIYQNYSTYTIDGKIAVDYIGRYENLYDDVKTICDRIGIPFDGNLPKAKGKSRSDKRHYSVFFTQDKVEFIKNRCSEEIQLFDYKFEKN